MTIRKTEIFMNRRNAVRAYYRHARNQDGHGMYFIQMTALRFKAYRERGATCLEAVEYQYDATRAWLGDRWGERRVLSFTGFFAPVDVALLFNRAFRKEKLRTRKTLLPVLKEWSELGAFGPEFAKLKELIEANQAMNALRF